MRSRGGKLLSMGAPLFVAVTREKGSLNPPYPSRFAVALRGEKVTRPATAQPDDERGGGEPVPACPHPSGGAGRHPLLRARTGLFLPAACLAMQGWMTAWPAPPQPAPPASVDQAAGARAAVRRRPPTRPLLPQARPRTESSTAKRSGRHVLYTPISRHVCSISCRA